MNTLNIKELSRNSRDYIVVGTRRLLAAVIGIAFPLATFSLIVGAVLSKRDDLESILTHPILLITLPPMLIALAIWCRRYIPPAVVVLMHSKPIVLENGALSILGKLYEIDDDTLLSYDQTKITLFQNGKITTSIPGFFIAIDVPRPQ